MDALEEVRSKIDIVDLIGVHVSLKKAGRNYKGLCPFHSEKTPSFMVSSERQRYKCFGCGESGDVFSFLEKYEGMSFLEALESLANRAGVKIERFRPSTQDLRKKRLLEVLHLAAEYYHWLLKNHAAAGAARDYLLSRKVGNEAIDRYGLGYSPNQWRSVSNFLVKKKGYTVEELEAVGLAIRSDKGFYDRFRHRIIFPLRDHKGAVVGFSGRLLDPEIKEAKYINSPETILYQKGKMLYGLYENREFIRQKEALVIVEGELDMIGSFQAGIKNVVAIKGSAFTNDQALLIRRYGKTLTLALDADEAGIEAAKRTAAIADEHDLSVRVVEIKGGKDPHDLATADPKVWRKSVSEAVSFYDFFLQSLYAKFDPSSGEGKKRITEIAIPLLSQISNVVERAHYVRKLAETLEVPEDSVYAEIDRSQKRQKLQVLAKKVEGIQSGHTSRREKLEEYLLALLLQFYADLTDDRRETKSAWFDQPAVRKVVDALLSWNKPKLDIKLFAATLPPELQELIDRTYLLDLASLAGTNIVAEFHKCRSELETISLRDRLSQLSQKIAAAEKAGQEEEVTGLRQQFTTLTKLMDKPTL